MMTDNKEMKDFPLRIPKALYKQVDERSKKNKRSVNSEIIILLERFIDSEEISIPSAKYIKAIDRAREQEEKKAQDLGTKHVDEMYEKIVKDDEISQKEKEA